MPRARFGSSTRYLALPAEVRLRREWFGGLVFDRRTGATVEVDQEAMALLLAIRERGAAREDSLAASAPVASAPRARDRRRRVVNELLALGCLVVPSPFDLLRLRNDGGGEAAGRRHRPETRCPTGPGLSAPETVH